MPTCDLCNAEINKEERIDCSIIFESHTEYGPVREDGPLIVSYCVDCNLQNDLSRKLYDAFSKLSVLLQLQRQSYYPFEPDLHFDLNL